MSGFTNIRYDVGNRRVRITLNRPEKRNALSFALLQELNDRITILLVSHDMGAISSYVKTVGCLNRRLFYHGGKELTAEMVELAARAHGVEA